MTDIWGKALEAMFKAWGEKRQPRRLMAKALVSLLLDMENCHECYTEYQSRRGQGDDTAALRKWGNAVLRLQDSFQKVDEVLAIFDLRSWKSARRYFSTEFGVLNFETLRPSGAVGESVPLINEQVDLLIDEGLMKASWDLEGAGNMAIDLNQILGRDPNPIQLADFDEATTALREFMRKNLTMEEVFAATP
jgi:hypothetical protein